MSSKKNHNNSHNSIYVNMIKNNVSPLDLFIISKLNTGVSLDELMKLAENEFNIKNLKKTIEERLKKLFSEDNLEDQIILNSKPTYITNPAKLYDNIMLILIKADLSSFDGKNIEIGIPDVYNTIVELNNNPRFGKPIKQLYTIRNWIFDFVGLVFENNLVRFNSFKDYMLKEGIAKTVDIIDIESDSGLLFNPVSTPDYNDFKNFLVNYRERMNSMVNELSDNNILFTKQTKYFNRENYGLKVISEKNKNEIYAIDLPEVKIGRYQDNDIILQEISVSRRHAKITRIDNTYIFKDESTNGSYINNEFINYNEKKLHDGDIIKIGKTKYLFHKLNNKR